MASSGTWCWAFISRVMAAALQSSVVRFTFLDSMSPSGEEGIKLCAYCSGGRLIIQTSGANEAGYDRRTVSV